jgi:hypothetical protein
MAILSLSVSFIHLELSAAKSPKEQALVLSMILFQRGRKMTELCATRMELDYAFPKAWSAMTNRKPVRDRLGALGWRRGS